MRSGGELSSGGVTDRKRARSRPSSASSDQVAADSGSASGCPGTSHEYPRRHQPPAARLTMARGWPASAAPAARASRDRSSRPGTRISMCTVHGSAGAS